MAEKQTNRERLKEITESIERGIQELFQSEKYAQYLLVMSRFHKYSLNNTMLIYLQRPDATVVAGFNKWRDQFGRNVMKGEKGIKIIAPTPYKKKIEEQMLDPDTKLPLLGADGEVLTEEKEIRIPMFKPVTVFDVSQTDGKPLPQLASDLAGNVQNYDVFMEALRRTSPVPISIAPVYDGADGYFDLKKQSITVQEGMSEIQTVCATIHEIAHSVLHNQPLEESAEGKEGKPKDRNTEEVEAESISYAVCAYYGIATGENSFGYIAQWSEGKELKELRESLDTINRTSSDLITGIDKHYREICQERGIAPELVEDVAEEQEIASVAEPIPEEPLAEAVEKVSEAEVIPEPIIEPEPAGLEEGVYTIPDPSMSIEAMNAYGYLDSDMLPLSKERALELLQRDVTVYMLYDDGSESMAFEEEDILLFSGLFGVTKEDWNQVCHEIPEMDAETIRQKREQAFLNNREDSFAIYQLNDSEQSTQMRFMDMAYLKKHDLEPVRERYNIVYSGTLYEDGNQIEKLEGLFRRFNINRPPDFTGHSLSVSDIVALKQNGVVSCHYVDSIGYKELPDFLNYLKTAEMQLEDDYGMIDGVINNGSRQPKEEKKPPEQAATERNVKAKKSSVLAKLRKFQEEDRRASGMSQRAERDFY